MIALIKRHRIRFTAIVLLMIFILVLINANLVVINYENGSQEILLFNITLENWTSIITIVGAILGIPWALYQYDHARKIRQQEKAATIANKFAENLLIDADIIGTVLRKYDKLTNIYNKINFTNLRRFDKYELKEISNDSNIGSKFMEIIHSQEINDFFHTFIKNNFPESKELLKIPFFHYFVSTLNKLEAISIDISSNAAGTEFIYPSLHQSLLPFIETISIYISAINGNYTFKYFINLIDVYNNWKRIRDKEAKRELSKQLNITLKSKKYKDKIKKIQNKALEKKPRKF